MELIDKSAVVAEIERRIDSNNEKAASYSSGSEHDYLCRVKENVYKDLISFLNTIEVKEIDLEKELDEYLDIHDCEFFYDDYLEFAKHFYELGLKVAQEK